MAIGDVILMVSCLAGLMAALPALLIFLNVAFVGTSDRAASRLAKGGIVPFFIGLGAVTFIVGPSMLMLATGSVAQFCGSILLLAFFFLGFLGLASVSRLVGYRVTELNEREASPLVQALAGALVLSFGIAFPLIGWLIVFPFSLIIGIGAIILALINGLLGRGEDSPTLQTHRPEYYQQQPQPQFQQPVYQQEQPYPQQPGD